MKRGQRNMRTLFLLPEAISFAKPLKPKSIYPYVNNLGQFFFKVLICLNLEISLLPSGIEALLLTGHLLSLPFFL